MPLTNTAIQNAKPGVNPRGVATTKTYKLGDTGGLYLEVTPAGSKWWRLKYRIDGKEKRLSLGVYPDVPLKAARERRDEARKLLAQGIDPSEHRKAMKSARADRAANSFEVVAREWVEKYRETWAEDHTERIVRRFERDVFPYLGDKAVSEITPPMILAVVRKIEARGVLALVEF